LVGLKPKSCLMVWASRRDFMRLLWASHCGSLSKCSVLRGSSAERPERAQTINSSNAAVRRVVFMIESPMIGVSYGDEDSPPIHGHGCFGNLCAVAAARDGGGRGAVCRQAADGEGQLHGGSGRAGV